MRKHSYEGNSEGQEDSFEMFPGVTTNQIESISENLKQLYKRQTHEHQLINYCFRCHNSPLRRIYEKFKNQKQPNLVQPQISIFYGKDSFVDMQLLGNYLEKEGSEYPFPHIPPVPKDLSKHLDQVFNSYGYLPNLERFLLYYPSYLEKHLMVQRQLFETQKIDIKIAYFLGICASAEMGCAYMMARMLKRFRKVGGELQWLDFTKVPRSLKDVLILNRKLSRAVWEVGSQDIQNILENSSYHWSQNQLVICIEILSFVHQNCTIALAMGLNIEQPLEEHQNIKIKEIITERQIFNSIIYQQQSQKIKLATMIPVLNKFDDKVQEETAQRKKSLKIGAQDERQQKETQPYMKQIGGQLAKQQLYGKIHKHCSSLLPQFEVIKKRNEKTYPTIDYSQFNFKFHAYPILSNLTHEVADRIQQLFAISDNMTRDNFGSLSSTNTKQFRKACRYYAQNICGYCHHEYNYKTNISMMTINFKFYIRLLAMSPLHITKQVINYVGHEEGAVTCFDLGHIAVLIANTKFSLELTMAIMAFEL